MARTPLFVLLAALATVTPARAELPEALSPSRPLVIIDPGHGGHDWGATANKAKLKEKDICLSVAKRLREHLRKDAGLSSRLTRENDSFIPLDKRVESTLDWNEAIFISLHVDQERNKRLNGIKIYAFGKSGQRWHPKYRRYKQLPPPPKEEAKASAQFAHALAQNMRSAGFTVEGEDKAEYYVLKNPDHPAVLVEMGYLSNPNEAVKLGDEAYQDRIAQGLARGLAAFLADSRQRPTSSAVAAR